MGTLTKSEQSHLPTSLPLSIDYQLGRVSNRLTSVGLSHEIMAEDAPSIEFRDQLQVRSAALANWMRPADGNHLIKQVAALIGSRPGQFGDKDDQKTAIRIFVETLKSLPRFALDKAFEDAHTGRLGVPPWVPTAADLHVAATRHLSQLAREKAKIDAVLNAKVVDTKIDPARRAEVSAMARRVAAEISVQGVLAERGRREASVRAAEAKREAEREKDRQASSALDALIREGKPDPRPMPKLSPEILRQFGVTEKQEAAE